MSLFSTRGGIIGSLILLALLAPAPWVAPALHLDLSIVTEVLLTAIAVMSVNLLLGYVGLSAFACAAFFGVGAYGAGLSISNWHVGFLEALLIGTGSAILAALVVSPFLLRRRGIYFALLFIAFGQVFYFIAYRLSDITGGEDGMSFSRPPLALFGLHAAVNETAMYYVTFGLFALAIFSFWLIVRSPFGRTLAAIKQNESRVKYLGLNTDRFIFVGILIAGAYAGIGGALYGLLLRFAFPLLLDWHQSGDFVMMTVIGGSGTIFGPLIGAFIYVLGKDVISSITPLWQIFLGGFFIVIVLAFPKGILGSIFDAFLRRRDVAPALAADDHAHVQAPPPVAGMPTEARR